MTKKKKKKKKKLSKGNLLLRQLKKRNEPNELVMQVGGDFNHPAVALVFYILKSTREVRRENFPGNSFRKQTERTSCAKPRPSKTVPAAAEKNRERFLTVAAGDICKSHSLFVHSLATLFLTCERQPFARFCRAFDDDVGQDLTFRA